MPKIIKTVKSESKAKSNTEIFMNAVKSVSYAIGSDYKLITNSDAADRGYYIPTNSIGYPGFCVVITAKGYSSGNPYVTMGIQTTTTSGDPDPEDKYTILGYTASSLVNYGLDYNPVTCALFSDDANDTVSFSIIPSNYSDGSDNSNKNVCNFTLKAFLAKDVKGDVLCGAGNTHIYQLRTATNNIKFKAGNGSDCGFSELHDILHLTKMVNYLSPGYPEMKTAHVCLVRPSSGFANESYYADGSRWGFPGYYPKDPESSTSFAHFLKPIEPWVKY